MSTAGVIQRTYGISDSSDYAPTLELQQIEVVDEEGVKIGKLEGREDTLVLSLSDSVFAGHIASQGHRRFTVVAKMIATPARRL